MAIVTTASAGMRAAGRATILQVRAPGSTARAIEREASALVAASPVPVVISSRCDIALAAGAAGVNLPENDISVAAARALMGERMVGRSVHSLESALRAESEGADYVIFGPVWASASHPASAPAGIAALAKVAHALRIPVLAIGGVTEDRIAAGHAAGAAGYAAIGLFESTEFA
jgi:thiamine-phosphate pyrophosphorylase